MPQVITELVELVEDHQVFARGSQFVALVEDFFDVGFRARRLDDLPGNAFEPFEALPAHAFGEDGNRLAPEQVRVVGATPAVVARGRPDRLGSSRIELAGHEPGHQAAEGCPHLVGSGWEPLALQDQDPRLSPGQLRGQFEEVDRPETAPMGCRLVVPVDSKQIARVEVPEPDVLELTLDGVGDQRRITHLLEGWDPNRPVSCHVNGRGESFILHGQVDHHVPFIASRSASKLGSMRMGSVPALVTARIAEAMSLRPLPVAKTTTRSDDPTRSSPAAFKSPA